MAEEIEHAAQVKRLSAELDKRVSAHEKIEPYLEGNCPYPPAVTEARLTKLYRHLMPAAEAPWGSLIVDAKLDRLEVIGIKDPNEEAARRVWEEGWQPNGMDAESQLGHGAALLDGRFYATVWPYDSDDNPVSELGGDLRPDIALDDSTQMIVEYAAGDRRRRVAALRRYQDGDRVYVTLYRPDGIFKYQGPQSSSKTPSSSVEWEKREVDDEDWPLPNPFNRVPVVELRVNGRLKPGGFPYARGEFAHCTGLIDRVNLLSFLGLIVAFWMGFPLRGVIGEKAHRRVLVDDDGEPIIDEATQKEKTEVVPPIDIRPDSFFQLTNPEAKLAQFDAADRSNLSIFDELQQLAVISKTPRHYFPMEGGMSNLGSETVNAFEGAMHAAVTKHKGSLGEGWEEVERLAGQVLGVELSQRAETLWADHESRSLAERADAASKLKDVIPQIAVAEIALNATPEQIARWQAMNAMNPLAQLVAAAKEPAPGIPEPVPNGNGAR